MNTVKIEMPIRAAAAIRQVLFKEQVGYTTNPDCTPERIIEIRQVISDLDSAIEEVVDG